MDYLGCSPGECVRVKLFNLRLAYAGAKCITFSEIIIM